MRTNPQQPQAMLIGGLMCTEEDWWLSGVLSRDQTTTQ